MRSSKKLLLFAMLALGCACASETVNTTSSGASSSTGSAGAGGGEPVVVADCTDGWCLVPAGTFVLGSPRSEWGRGLKSEEQVEVTFTSDRLVQQHETTQAEWASFGLANPSKTQPDGTGDCFDPTCPVGNLTWFEALAFANLMSDAHVPALAPCYALDNCTGEVGEGMTCESVSVTAASPYACEGFRLPTELEWEYVARARTSTAFYSGDIAPQADISTCFPDPNLDAVAWYCDNAGVTPHAVGTKPPNGWGLHDVLGNAYEWVQDRYTSDGYGVGPLVDPGGTDVTNTLRVYRGGGFNAPSSLCRAASRLYVPWESSYPSIGVRLVRSVAQ